jgi:hypothetical protein
MTFLQDRLNRRYFLRGLGACLALPQLESLGNTISAAPDSRLPGTTTAGNPLRTAFLYVPNGVNVDLWRPTTSGPNYQLSETLQPLAQFHHDLQIFSGLAHANGTAGKDGPGDHARAGATFLTGARPKKTAGSDIRAGISVDQLAAQHVGTQARFRSLELSCDNSRLSGNCDSGYSCAYQYNISWQSPTTPVATESNPRLVFERLFGAGPAAERSAALARQRGLTRSVIDFVSEDARQLVGEVSQGDRAKLDEYLTGVREIEKQIQRVEALGEAPQPGFDAPDGIPDNYRDHIRLMFDLLAVAFQTDSTRVATFLLAHDGSNRTFPEIEVNDGHHYLSHHGRDQEKMAKIARIDKFYVEQLAYFLGKIGTIKDADGSSLLDNAMIVWGGGLADGHRHQHDNLPIVLAGHGGGELTTGRHVDFGNQVPMTNLYVSMLQKMGTGIHQFGDSTGRVEI